MPRIAASALFAVVLGLALCGMAPVALAGPKLSYAIVFNPGCVQASCPVDTITGKVDISPSKVTGANGLAFKLKLSKASKAGVPVNAQDLKMVFGLSIDGALCNNYESPTFALVNGKAKAAFTGSTTTPPVPESTGSVLLSCDFIGFLTDGSNQFALPAIVFGVDQD